MKHCYLALSCDAESAKVTGCELLRVVVMRLMLILLSLSPFWVFADQCTADDRQMVECTETNRWQFALAIGAGHRSNPLLGGRNFPLFLMPDLNYYGKNWFFDNGTVGYSWILSDDMQLSFVSRLNEEKGYFRRHHLSNLFTQQVSGSASLMGPTQKYHQPSSKLLVHELHRRLLGSTSGEGAGR